MHVKIIPTPESAGQVIHFSMIVYETKNRDQQRSVDLVANIQKNSRNNKRKDLEVRVCRFFGKLILPPRPSLWTYQNGIGSSVLMLPSTW